MSKLIVQAIINKVKETNKDVLLGISDDAESNTQQLKLEASILQYKKDNGGNDAWATALHKVLANVLGLPYRQVVTGTYPAQWRIVKSKYGTKKATGIAIEDGSPLLSCNNGGYMFSAIGRAAYGLRSDQVEQPTKDEAAAFLASLEQLNPGEFYRWFADNVGVGALNSL